MIRLFLLCVLFLSASLPAYSQALGFSLADGRKRVEIPIEIYNNLVVVPVVLNGALPLKFILDTGVRTAILTQKTFTDILNLAYSRKYTISGPGGEHMIDAYITNNVSLELPGVTGRGHALLVLGEDYLELRNYLGTDVHGILGYELFSRFIIEIDYEKKVLTLYQPKRFH
ncbi:MAG TPA: aspartyl protease family protein, partial [Chryseosolibacter sp.]|nr:aspartyl protease family protein [Chryseosolibacter sp.]